MGFRDRLRSALGWPDKRAISPFGTSAIPPNSWGGAGNFAQVDLRQAEDGLQAVAVWAATNLVAQVCSTMPLDTYRKRSADAPPEKIANPRLIDDPGGEGYGVTDWIYQYLMSKLLRGNAYGRLGLADASGFPAQVVLLHPDDVQGWRDRTTGEVKWLADGRPVPAGQMWHQRSYPMPGRLLGMSPVQHHALTIGQGLSAARFGAQWFQDGAHPSSMLTNSEVPIDRQQGMEVKARYMQSLQGSREPLVLGKGWAYQAIQVSPEESQFLATQRYTAADCARIYGPGLPEILGYETGGSMTYANIEQRSADLLTYTLDPWLTGMERMFTSLLPRTQYVKFNRAALLRTDLFTRYRAHALGIAAHFLAPSEARHLEDLPPLTPAQQAELDALVPAGPLLNPVKETER